MMFVLIRSHANKNNNTVKTFASEGICVHIGFQPQNIAKLKSAANYFENYSNTLLRDIMLCLPFLDSSVVPEHLRFPALVNDHREILVLGLYAKNYVSLDDVVFVYHRCQWDMSQKHRLDILDLITNNKKINLKAKDISRIMKTVTYSRLSW